MKDFLNTDDYEQETIRRALEGEHEAGREALLLCRNQLTARSLSPALADYLAARLNDVLEGIKPDRALCIAKPPGKPPDPFPEWQQQLGALAALLIQRGYKPSTIAEALDDARLKLFNKNLDDREARRIIENFKPMQSLDVGELTRYAGRYGEILEEYPPCK